MKVKGVSKMGWAAGLHPVRVGLTSIGCDSANRKCGFAKGPLPFGASLVKTLMPATRHPHRTGANPPLRAA